MADIHLEWGGGFEFGPSNDLRIATNANFARQRIIRGLLNGPRQVDGSGQVVRPADDPFNPNWGAGLGRDVDTNDDATTRADRDSRIKTHLSQEPVVDQTQPVTVDFGQDLDSGISFALIQCTTIDGEPVVTALQQ